MSRVAYVEHGKGPATLFVHAYFLNGYQWRGALERLHSHRRCLAPDVMSMGYTQTSSTQMISPETQVEMLAALLDSLIFKLWIGTTPSTTSGKLRYQHGSKNKSGQRRVP